ncbi:MAG: hypothetical protein C0490_23255 [Marivirga sp.]|nr:hypothetical protein [Marivirga sp.]
MRLLDKLSDLFFRIKFANVPEHFKSKDNLFNLTFDENWVYSKKGNSFYSFHNLKDDLKGGLQFSIQWRIRQPESMNEKEALLQFIEISEDHKNDIQTVNVSTHQAIHYSKTYEDSNMIFYYWYIYHEQILVIITYMIFEEEPDNVKSKWLKRVTDIINSLALNVNKFHTTPMT